MWTILAQVFSAKKEKQEVRPRDGHVEHVCKFLGLSVKNGVDIWTFVLKNQ